MARMRTLRQCLLDCDLTLLRVIAEQWGIELVANRHHDAAVELAAHMTAHQMDAELMPVLTPAEHAALCALLAADGQMPVGAFTRSFGEIRLMGPGRLERERPWTSPQSVAESLWYNGLIYRAFDEGPGGMQEIICIPPELRAGLQERLVQRQDTITLPLAQPPHPAPAPPALNDAVCTLLAYAHQHTLECGAPGSDGAGWQRRHLALMAQLADSSLDHEFLIHLVERAGLIKAEGLRWRPVPQRVMDWLRASPFEQTRALFDAWRDDPTWNDLQHVPGLRCEDTGSWHNDPLVARQTVLDYLAFSQPGVWYSLEGFVAAIKTHRPDFQRPGGDYDGWYIRDAQTGDYVRGFASWDRVDGALLRYLLAGPLAWLGIVQISTLQSPPSNLHPLTSNFDPGALTLTKTGAALLGKSEAPEERGDARFEVDADGVVRVGNVRRLDRFQLARVADWVRTENSVWLFHITPASLERAKRQHISVERVIHFFEESTGQPAPELLAQALQRWGERGAEVWANQVVMLRVARPQLLEQLMSQPATRRLIREPISSTVASVLPEHWPALRQALLEMGVLVESKA